LGVKRKGNKAFQLVSKRVPEKGELCNIKQYHLAGRFYSSKCNVEGKASRHRNVTASYTWEKTTLKYN